MARITCPKCKISFKEQFQPKREEIKKEKMISVEGDPEGPGKEITIVEKTSYITCPNEKCMHHIVLQKVTGREGRV